MIITAPRPNAHYCSVQFQKMSKATKAPLYIKETHLQAHLPRSGAALGSGEVMHSLSLAD
jgi:hypothetical protein